MEIVSLTACSSKSTKPFSSVFSSLPICRVLFILVYRTRNVPQWHSPNHATVVGTAKIGQAQDPGPCNTNYIQASQANKSSSENSSRTNRPSSEKHFHSCKGHWRRSFLQVRLLTVSGLGNYRTYDIATVKAFWILFRNCNALSWYPLNMSFPSAETLKMSRMAIICQSQPFHAYCPSLVLISLSICRTAAVSALAFLVFVLGADLTRQANQITLIPPVSAGFGIAVGLFTISTLPAM